MDCHWHPTAYDREKVQEEIRKAQDKGIKKFIGVPLDFHSNKRLLELSETFDPIYPTVGIHPKYAPKSSSEHVEKICTLLEKPQVVAAGEIGLDLHFLDETTKEQQLKVFRKILHKAVHLNLPIILHCPRGEPKTFEEVKKAEANKVVFHWYTGPHEILRKIISTENYYISVTPAIHYSGKLQKIVNITDLENIIVESDGPTNYRDIGKGNPYRVKKIIEKISSIKNVPVNKVEKITTENAKQIFKI